MTRNRRLHMRWYIFSSMSYYTVRRRRPQIPRMTTIGVKCCVIGSRRVERKCRVSPELRSVLKSVSTDGHCEYTQRSSVRYCFGHHRFLRVVKYVSPESVSKLLSVCLSAEGVRDCTEVLTSFDNFFLFLSKLYPNVIARIC